MTESKHEALRRLRDANAAMLASLDARLGGLRCEFHGINAAVEAYAAAGGAVVHRAPSASTALRFRDPFSAPNRRANGQRLRPQPSEATRVLGAAQELHPHPAARGWLRAEDEALDAAVASYDNDIVGGEADEATSSPTIRTLLQPQPPTPAVPAGSVAPPGRERLSALDWDRVSSRVQASCADKTAYAWSVSPAALVGKSGFAARQRLLMSSVDLGCPVAVAAEEAAAALAKVRELETAARSGGRVGATSGECHAVWARAVEATRTPPFELLRLAIRRELSGGTDSATVRRAGAARWSAEETEALSRFAATCVGAEAVAVAMAVDATSDLSTPLGRFTAPRSGAECAKRAKRAGICITGDASVDAFAESSFGGSRGGSVDPGADGADDDDVSDVPYAERFARRGEAAASAAVTSPVPPSPANDDNADDVPYAARMGQSRVRATKTAIEAAVAASAGSIVVAARLLTHSNVGYSELASFVQSMRRSRRSTPATLD